MFHSARISVWLVPCVLIAGILSALSDFAKADGEWGVDGGPTDRVIKYTWEPGKGCVLRWLYSRISTLEPKVSKHKCNGEQSILEEKAKLGYWPKESWIQAVREKYGRDEANEARQVGKKGSGDEAAAGR